MFIHNKTYRTYSIEHIKHIGHIKRYTIVISDNQHINHIITAIIKNINKHITYYNNDNTSRQ